MLRGRQRYVDWRFQVDRFSQQCIDPKVAAHRWPSRTSDFSEVSISRDSLRFVRSLTTQFPNDLELRQHTHPWSDRCHCRVPDVFPKLFRFHYSQHSARQVPSRGLTLFLRSHNLRRSLGDPALRDPHRLIIGTRPCPSRDCPVRARSLGPTDPTGWVWIVAGRRSIHRRSRSYENCGPRRSSSRHLGRARGESARQGGPTRDYYRAHDAKSDRMYARARSKSSSGFVFVGTKRHSSKNESRGPRKATARHTYTRREREREREREARESPGKPATALDGRRDRTLTRVHPPFENRHPRGHLFDLSRNYRLSTSSKVPPLPEDPPKKSDERRSSGSATIGDEVHRTLSSRNSRIFFLSRESCRKTLIEMTEVY